MKQIIDAVVKELKGKNPGMDVFKMCLRVAVNTSGREFTDEELNAIFKECSKEIGFNPIDERGVLGMQYYKEDK